MIGQVAMCEIHLKVILTAVIDMVSTHILRRRDCRDAVVFLHQLEDLLSRHGEQTYVELVRSCACQDIVLDAWHFRSGPSLLKLFEQFPARPTSDSDPLLTDQVLEEVVIDCRRRRTLVRRSYRDDLAHFLEEAKVALTSDRTIVRTRHRLLNDKTSQTVTYQIERVILTTVELKGILEIVSKLGDGARRAIAIGPHLPGLFIEREVINDELPGQRRTQKTMHHHNRIARARIIDLFELRLHTIRTSDTQNAKDRDARPIGAGMQVMDAQGHGMRRAIMFARQTAPVATFITIDLQTLIIKSLKYGKGQGHQDFQGLIS